MASEAMLTVLEERGQSYLFKLRLTQNVKHYIERVFWNEGCLALQPGHVDVQIHPVNALKFQGEVPFIR